jgi:MFS family permease
VSVVTAVNAERRPLAALYLANGVSLSGNVMALTAIPWFVLQTTGSPTKTGIVAFFGFLPVVVASFLGGALVDRLGPKRMSVLADVMSGATVAMIPLLHATGHLTFPMLLTLVFLGALLDTPGMSARSALVPTLAARAGWPLERATGVTATVERGSRLAGAPLAGVLIALGGPITVLWIDAATFAVSALVVILAVPGDARPSRVQGSRYLAEIKEGFAFLRRDRPLAAIAKLLVVTNFLDAWTSVLLIVYAAKVYGSAVSLGAVIGAFGAGSMFGAILFARRGAKFSRHRLFGWCFLAFTIKYPALAMFPSLGILMVFAFLAGTASGPVNPLIDTVSYERIPIGLRGRVLSALGGVAWMAMPLGVLAGGFVLDHASLRINVIIVGASYVAAAGTIWLSSAMRAMDAEPAETASGEVTTLSANAPR